jgi:transcriptional regulator with PAS, ATPase and Fis domain
MTDKELKKLSRAELLELLLIQTKENEKLRERLKKREEKLNERRIKIEQAGSLAEAVLAVNKVMEAAQEAANQYLENIAALEAETKEKCEKLLAEAAASNTAAENAESAAIEQSEPLALPEGETKAEQ